MRSAPGDANSGRRGSDQRGDLAWAFAELAAPVLRRMFNPGELSDARVTATVEGPAKTTITLWVKSLGHSGAAVLWDSTSELSDASLTDLRMHAADLIQDMIAESPDAWGELRTFERADFE